MESSLRPNFDAVKITIAHLMENRQLVFDVGAHIQNANSFRNISEKRSTVTSYNRLAPFQPPESHLRCHHQSFHETWAD
jgi:hypothetical protein